MAPLIEIFKSAVDVAVVRPAGASWQTKGAAREREKREQALRAMEVVLDRNPELYYCGGDDLVVLRGGSRAISSGEAGRLLMRGDDARLLAVLS